MINFLQHELQNIPFCLHFGWIFWHFYLDVRIPILDWWSSSQPSSRDPVRAKHAKYTCLFIKKTTSTCIYSCVLYAVSCNSVYLCRWSCDLCVAGHVTRPPQAWSNMHPDRSPLLKVLHNISPPKQMTHLGLLLIPCPTWPPLKFHVAS